MKEVCKKITNIIIQTCKKSFFWFICIFYLETIFMLLMHRNLSWQWLMNVSIASFSFAQIFSIFTGPFKNKGNTIATFIILAIIGVLYSTQAVFYNIFKVYFSLYNLALQDQIKGFLKDTFLLILKNTPYIILLMLPLIIFLIIRKKIQPVTNKISIGMYIILLMNIVLGIGINLGYQEITKKNNYSTYELHHNVNNVSLNIKRLGVLNSYELEIERIIFGYNPEKIEAVAIEEKEEKEIIYEPNQLNLNLNDTENGNINLINAYIKSEEPTLKNEFTGIFKGYNLVYITAESFSEIGVNELLTPTLYRLTHSGLIFKNFYTPNNLSTIGGEFQSLTGLYPDYSILSKWRSGSNAFPYGLANVYRREGYSTYAYHNNSYVFQDRHQYLASQGFNNYLGCYNGLEKRMNCGRWPQSDDEMIEVTTSDYIDSDQPFLAYYMTVSGHFGYTFVGNSISSKNRGYVQDMEKSEGAKAYVATQIELDKALERLLTTLKEKGKLDNTVIVMLADHYPYGLDIDSINSLSLYPKDDIEVNHNALVIWNSQLENKVIEKPCMAIDVIPTVYNLFGIDYDSRLFAGKDILSNSFGVAVMTDRSWVTSKGTYKASTNEFVPKEEVEEGYVEKVNQLVNNRLNISRMIIQNNYYWYLTR